MRTKIPSQRSLSWTDLINAPFFVDANWSSFDNLWQQTEFERSHRFFGSANPQSYAKAKSCAARWYACRNKLELSYTYGYEMRLYVFGEYMTFERAVLWGEARGHRQAGIVNLLALLTVDQLRTCIYSNLDPQRTSIVVTHSHGKKALVPVLLAGHCTLMFDEGCRGGRGLKPGTPFLFLT